MKLRIGTPHLPAFLHRHDRSGQSAHGHEGIFRVIQLVLMVVVALVGAKLIAGGAVLAVRMISGYMS